MSVNDIVDTGNVVPEIDRSVSDRLIIYAEVGSMQRTAQMLGVSKNTLRKNIERIRQTIQHELDN